MDKNILKLTIIEQRNYFERKERIIERNIPQPVIENKKITAISGIRRCGKSTLMKQISKKYLNYYYLNFEDERLLDFTYFDFNSALEIFISLYGMQSVFFFDEIQNINGWEKFVRRLFNEGNKVFITGSNAKLMSSELATSLTGRHLKIELFPFSFKEFLSFKNFPIKSQYITKEKGQLLKYFDEYILMGGFPEVIISRDENELKQLYQDILIKDIIIRNKIRDVKSFRELSLYLISNCASQISFNNLKKITGINSVTSIKNYISFLESSYLNFLINKYDFSMKKQIINNKKIYCIDNGIINYVSFAFSPNSGKILENVVFLELLRRGNEIYYHREKHECDFISKEGSRIRQAIQVTSKISVQNKEREINGLTEALEKYDLREGIIFTQDQEDEILTKRKKITILPIWKWLLEV